MAGRQWQPTHSRYQSRVLLLILLPLMVAFLIFLFSVSSFYSPSAIARRSSVVFSSTKPETSFLVSLGHFLPRHPAQGGDDTVGDFADDATVARFDESVSKCEVLKLLEEPHYPMVFPIRVYVYDTPRKFTYDLLELFLNTYGDTTNLTSNGSPVHRLIEQHSADYWLWADLLAPDSERLIQNVVVRVYEQEDAGLFYIPFFTTISFFLLEKQQCKALYRVKC